MQKLVWALLHTDDRTRDTLKLFWSQDARLQEYRRIMLSAVKDDRHKLGWDDKTCYAVERIREHLNEEPLTAGDILAAWDEFLEESNGLLHGNHERYDTYMTEIEMPDLPIPMPPRPDVFKSISDFEWLLVLQVAKAVKQRMAEGNDDAAARNLGTSDVDACWSNVIAGLTMEPQLIPAKCASE